MLHVLGRTLGSEYLVTGDDRVALRGNGNLWLDIEHFRGLIAACRGHGHDADVVCPSCLPLLTQAADLYRDDFLAGFSLPDSPDFDRWQFFQGEQLRTELALVLDLLTRGLSDRGHWLQAMVYAQRQLALDPLSEPAHRQLMRLYAWTEQPGAALRQYELCIRLLADGLGVPPAAETDALHREIQARRLTRPRARHADTAPQPAYDDIRVLTVASIGLVGEADDTADNDVAARVEQLQALLALVRDAAAPYGGVVEQVAGEDLLLLYGRDRIHEDDAERAVRTAVATLDAATAQGLAIRIGINTGMAYCRRGETAAIAILGSVVSLATRLRNRAEVGQALLGRHTYLATRGLCDTRPHTLTLPGMAEPLPAYALLHLRTRAEKQRGIEGLRADLVGRDRELSELQASLAKAMAGEGQLVALVGPAGIGKSRLVTELKQYAAQGHVSRFTQPSPLFLEGRGLEHAMNSPYWLFVDMLRGYLGSEERETRRRTKRTEAGAVAMLLQGLCDEGLLTPDEVEEIGPLLGWLLSLSFGMAWDDQLVGIDADQVRRRLLAAMPRFFAALAGRQPLALICEDLHWADPLSLDVIGALMGKLASVPMAILAVYRPEAGQADGELVTLARRRCPERFTKLTLQPLSEEESRQLVASLLAVDELMPSVRGTITEKAQGNPLYLEEVVRSFIDTGTLYRDGTTWRSRTLASSETVPATLQSIILSRIDGLDPDETAYLQAASVLGRLFRPRLVAAMLQGSDQDTTLAALVEESLVHQDRTQPEAEYSFHHVLVRDAIYQDLPRGRRVDLHRRAALAIEQLYANDLQAQIELLAHHYDRGEDASKAVHYLLLAGQKAKAAYLNRQACTHFERTLEWLDELEPSTHHQMQRIEASHRLGEVHEMLEDLEEAERYLREAIALAADQALPPRQRVDIILSLCQLFASTGDNCGLVEQSEQGLALIVDLEMPAEFVAFTTYLASASAYRGDWRLAMEHVESVIELIAELPYSRHLKDVYILAVLWCRFNKQIERGFDLVTSAIDRALQRRDYWSAAQLYLPAKMFLHETIGDVDGILACLLESKRYAEMVGDEVMIRGARYWLSVHHGWLMGNLDEAERYARFDLESRSELYQPNSYLFAQVVLGLVHYCRRAWPAAAEALERAHALAASGAFRVDGVRRGIVGLAWAYVMLGRKAEGLALLADIAKQEELHVETWPTVACALAGLAAMCADDTEYDAVCSQIIAARQEEPLPLVQWRLKTAELDARFEGNGAVIKPRFSEKRGLSGWTWHDPFGDCSYEIENSHLIIRAANYHDLWLNNFAAPRLLRPVEGDFAVDTICAAAYQDRPALGGLLLWQDREHYLRLTWNTLAPDGVNLLGCLGNVDGLHGIGRLPGAHRAHLRLERTGDRVRALCSADGIDWYSVAEVDFPADGPVQVGPLAIGMIHRYVHAGAWPEGSAIRFEAFRLRTDH